MLTNFRLFCLLIKQDANVLLISFGVVNNPLNFV